MKKEYLIYKLSEEMKEATRIDTELFSKFVQIILFKKLIHKRLNTAIRPFVFVHRQHSFLAFCLC